MLGCVNLADPVGVSMYWFHRYQLLRTGPRSNVLDNGLDPFGALRVIRRYQVLKKDGIEHQAEL